MVWDKIKALTFDFYGTLFDWEGSIKDETEKVLNSLGAQVDIKTFLQFWRTMQLEYAMMNTLMEKKHESFMNLTKHALFYTLKTFEVKAEGRHIPILTELWAKLRPFPEVEDALEELKEKYRLVILSNGDRDVLVSNAKLCRIPFDHIISAEMAQAYKPSPKVYLTAQKVLGLKPHQIMHVARAQFDIFGSKAVGMNATWVNRAAEPLAEGFVKPDYVVKDFTELVELTKM